MISQVTDDESILAFLKNLSSDSPAPGGGSTASLVGSLAAGLIAMACRISIKKEEGQSQDQFEDILRKVDELRDEFLTLCDKDTKAFTKVVHSYRLSPDIPKRKVKIEKALKQATRIPCRVANACLDILGFAEKTIRGGTKSSVTDLGAAVYLSEAALQAALLNVDINLKSIDDEEFRKRYMKKRNVLSNQAEEKKELIIGLIKDKL